MSEKIARFLIDLIVRLTSQLEVYGLEHLQEFPSYIIAANHIGRLDAILIYHFTSRRDMIVMVAEKYKKIALVRWFAQKLNAVFIDRFNADFATTREVLKRLKRGGALVMAPEGTRSPNARLQEGWAGASYLAQKAGIPIIPVGLAGSEDSRYFANLRRLRRTKIVIRIGDPFRLPSIRGGDREAALRGYTEEIMCRIAALLPPEYRGFYADHPRLKELLEAT
jgi:1-acyl-sn-glycerol-3-phosphate acyltransferase